MSADQQSDILLDNTCCEELQAVSYLDAYPPGHVSRRYGDRSMLLLLLR